MVIHEKFIFAHMPKAGGSFIEQWCKECIPGTRKIGPGWKKHRYLIDVPKEERDGKFKFGAIRNPFSWYVSWWMFNGVRKKPGNSFPNIADRNFKPTMKRLFKQDTLYQVGTPQKKIPMFVPFGILKSMGIGLFTFKFISTFCEWKPLLCKGRLTERAVRERILTDTFLAVEKLRADLDYLFNKQIGMKLTEEQRDLLYDKPRANVTTSGDYRRHYDDEIKELIYKNDRLLIDMFGYNFDDGEIVEDRTPGP